MTESIPFSERRTLRIGEATQYSGLGKTSIYDAIRAGKIEAAKIGTRRLIFRESLDRWLESMSNGIAFDDGRWRPHAVKGVHELRSHD